MPFRLLALMLAVVLVVTFATPAKAEAFDVLTGLAIAGAVVIVLVLVAYLVIANVEGDKRVEQRQEVWLACAAERCVTLPGAPAAAALAVPTREAP
jgi:amino acid transporter